MEGFKVLLHVVPHGTEMNFAIFHEGEVMEVTYCRDWSDDQHKEMLELMVKLADHEVTPKEILALLAQTDRAESS